MTEYDVAIVGAGPAGSVCATLLARQGLRVALIDRADFPRDKVCGDGITPRGARTLARMGLLPPVAAAAQANRGVTIRGGTGRSFSIAFDRDPVAPSDLLVIPRRVLDDLLLKEAISAGARFLPGVKVLALERRPAGGCTIGDASGVVLSAQLAVLATGAESQLLRAAGLLSRKPVLEHAARVYFDDIDGLDQNVTLFFDGVDMPGYGWIFPTGARSANIGCGVFDQHGMRQAKRLAQLIAGHPLLAPLLRHGRQRQSIQTYPLRTDFSAEFAGTSPYACIGEAAGLVNPITGEGIDYAFESAEFLALALASHWSRGRGAAEPAVIKDYRARLARRFSRRFRLYRWIQQHCLSSANTAEFLAMIETSPTLQRVLVDGLFGRSRLSSCLQPEVLYTGLKLAWRNRRQARMQPLAAGYEARRLGDD